MRVTVLASTIPLLLAGVVAGGELVPSANPCIAMGRASMQIATAPWQNPLHVSFTDDPEMATVRVQVVDAADMADFTVIDGTMTAEADSCTVNRDTSFVSISDRHLTDTDPVIYLSRDPGADYRIFVQSRAFSTKDAAALVVGAGRRVQLSERVM
ncbi:hypothetical protein [Afipia clevelandensis]|uniref:Uncharacterized protein n=1 Tax=Afipia clevelandensis ATCC 49720 TaxID=883079 RepID=K8NXJ6_9BRAD|nr:hypothetical protein [Afipia clevelandensis]EKS33896.1 hypothetical protein HMPREF9696_03016 [Afipia clevelandensis ATCC 49720]